MCGFVAIVNRSNASVDRDILRTMNSTIRHRGPDGEGIFVDRNVGFGFNRLSILDLRDIANQPMLSNDGRYVIVFNGEIYNYVELREELKKAGHEFQTTGDTEVLLHAFMEWGAGCLPMLNGMWSFLVLDRKTMEIFVSRDRFGIKPLFYHRSGKTILFASEAKSIVKSGIYDAQVNWSIAGQYLFTGKLDYDNDSFFEGIHRFPPGSYAYIPESGSFDVKRYWELEPQDASAPENPAEEFAEIFESSVRLRLRSDVPVGVLLSGGLDSTSIICSVSDQKRRLGIQPVERTAAFSFNDQEFDESEFVTDTIKQTGAELNSLKGDPARFWADLDSLLYFNDEPVHSSSALIGYKLMELAAQNGVKVVLNGQGADETLAGYPNYFEHYWFSLFVRGQIAKGVREIWTRSAYDGRSPMHLLRNQLLYIVRAGLSRSQAYQELSNWRQRKRMRDSTWYTTKLLDRVPAVHSGRWRMGLNDVLQDSVESFPLPLYLRVEDRNSMAHSIEARLPFLDYRLVQFAFNLSESWKMRGIWNKYILREAMRSRIPESVRKRVEKFGFPTPINRWIRESDSTVMEDLIQSDVIAKSGLFNVDRIRVDVERHLRNEINIGHEVFRLIQFEKWARITGLSVH